MPTGNPSQLAPTPAKAAGTVGRRLGFLIPVAVFAAIALALGVGLTLRPDVIPSALIGKPVPEFDLPPVKGSALGLSSNDLRGEVSLVNVWASWCTECRREHPLFMELERQRIVPVHGLNYKDEPDDARQWLDSLGDPYTRNGADRDGRVGIEWGVYGVPETFVVDTEGRIAYKHIGAVDERVLRETIVPLIEDLRAAGARPAPEGADKR
jgi:cytochrome c biogenesis protein CcmG/thiol:disulfide interchange protein DsbE